MQALLLLINKDTIQQDGSVKRTTGPCHNKFLQVLLCT